MGETLDHYTFDGDTLYCDVCNRVINHFVLNLGVAVRCATEHERLNHPTIPPRLAAGSWRK